MRAPNAQTRAVIGEQEERDAARADREGGEVENAVEVPVEVDDRAHRAGPAPLRREVAHLRLAAVDPARAQLLGLAAQALVLVDVSRQQPRARDAPRANTAVEASASSARETPTRAAPRPRRAPRGSGASSRLRDLERRGARRERRRRPPPRHPGGRDDDHDPAEPEPEQRGRRRGRRSRRRRSQRRPPRRRRRRRAGAAAGRGPPGRPPPTRGAPPRRARARPHCRPRSRRAPRASRPGEAGAPGRRRREAPAADRAATRAAGDRRRVPAGRGFMPGAGSRPPGEAPRDGAAIGRPQDAALGDDAAHVARRCHVERRVERRDAGRRQPPAAGVRDLGGVALLDRDRIPVRQRPGRTCSRGRQRRTARDWRAPAPQPDRCRSCWRRPRSRRCGRRRRRPICTAPLRRKCPAAVSAMTVTGMRSRESSHAVSLAPWQRGRVSSASTDIFLPSSHAARITPRAVPKPAVASAPALQWVSTTSPSSISAAP